MTDTLFVATDTVFAQHYNIVQLSLGNFVVVLLAVVAFGLVIGLVITGLASSLKR